MRLTFCLLLTLAGAAAADAAPPRAASAKGRPDEVFGLAKVWSIHLTIQARDWDTMLPSRGGFGRADDRTKPAGEERKQRGGYGFDFEYVKAEVNIDGAVLKDVGVRFKGNSSYAQAQGLKKPFRLELDRYVEGQSFKGVRKVSLSNHVMDPSAARENLSFAVYRAAGVAAPRTAYAELYLTVPGKHDREVLGLYTLVEAVDKPFLKDRFGSAKGVVFKPERVGPLDYLGEDWAEYEARYRPRPKADAKARKRLMDLCWLVQQSDEKKFRAEIGKQIDVDGFLRYLACTVALSSADSFVGLGHNYYLYLDPKKDRFAFIPWDLDHSFGGLHLVGSSSRLGDLSVRRPHLGRNRLVDRILADERNFETYKGHLKKVLAGPYAEQRVKADLVAVAKATAAIREREKQASAWRKEPKPNLLVALFTASPDLAGFAGRRSASIEAQLGGKSKGTEINFTWFGLMDEPAWLGLARPALDAADRDGDGVTKQEAAAAVRALFKACDRANAGSLDEKALSSALAKVLPHPHNRPGARGFPAALARSLIQKAGKDGKLTADALASLVEASFAGADRDRSGKLDEREIADALRRFVPSPSPFGAPPAPPKKEGR